MNPIEAAHQYVIYDGDWIEFTNGMTQEELEVFWDEVWTQRRLQEEEEWDERQELRDNAEEFHERLWGGW